MFNSISLSPPTADQLLPLDIARNCTEGWGGGSHGGKGHRHRCTAEACSTYRKNSVEASAPLLAAGHATHAVDMGT